MRIAFLALLGMTITSSALADKYSCAKMVAAGGWFKKYEYIGNTWGANTQKSGVLSSILHSSIEKTTSSVDPGISTKNLVSTLQYSSSWGECSMLNYEVTMQMRKDYIEQNADEIKTEIALGQGIHIDSLAFVSGCHNLNETAWKESLQNRAVEFYEQKNANDFVNVLDRMIQTEPKLAGLCSLES